MRFRLAPGIDHFSELVIATPVVGLSQQTPSLAHDLPVAPEPVDRNHRTATTQFRQRERFLMIRTQKIDLIQGWCTQPVSGGMRDCSLIVPTYKRASDVERLLRRLTCHERESTGSVPYEIVVVDGSPGNATEEMVRSLSLEGFPFLVKYLRTPPGLTRQRNVGIAGSSGDYVFFLDDDTLPEPGYFQIIRQIFESDQEQLIGAVAGCVWNEWNHPLILRWRIRFALGIVPRIEPMRYSHCGTSNPRTMLTPFTGIREVDLLPGCAFTFRRQVVARERFSLFFEGYSQGEDMEMSLRVGQRWKLVCSGDARVFHAHTSSGRPASFAKGRMEVRNRVFIWRRHSKNQAGLIDRIRMIADFAFLLLVDLAGFFSRPWRIAPILHGAGVFCGAIECLVRPPDFNEESHRVTYVISLSALAESSQQSAGTKCEFA